MTCPGAPPITLVPVRTVLDIPYGTGATTGAPKQLLMDAILPDDGKLHPPVLMIHGGGFTSGKRTDPDIVKMMTYFAARGFACFSPSYRMMDENPVLETMTQAAAEAIVTAVGKPEAYGALLATEDVHKARAFLDTGSKRIEYGLAQVPWGLVGQSAGAITALFTGYAGRVYWNPSLKIGENVGAVVDLWGALPPGVMTFPAPPVLAIHGTRDALLDYKASTTIVEDAARQRIPFERITILDGVHGHESARIFERPYRNGVIIDRVVSFLTENLVHA